jgi:gamma-glutamyl phosphate reductase
MLWFSSRVHESQEALSAATIALEIISRNARVQALQERRDYLRASLDLILNQRGADMADLPGGTSGVLVRDCKRKRADRWQRRSPENQKLAALENPAQEFGTTMEIPAEGVYSVR